MAYNRLGAHYHIPHPFSVQSPSLTDLCDQELPPGRVNTPSPDLLRQVDPFSHIPILTNPTRDKIFNCNCPRGLKIDWQCSRRILWKTSTAPMVTILYTSNNNPRCRPRATSVMGGMSTSYLPKITMINTTLSPIHLTPKATTPSTPIPLQISPTEMKTTECPFCSQTVLTDPILIPSLARATLTVITTVRVPHLPRPRFVVGRRSKKSNYSTATSFSTVQYLLRS